ncbi:branched-chain amino acid ABC transporter permease [Caldisphaera sp.]|uniref:branched-chain amino acid ABC transporter permease n=1 Tax=Caldisphaera sp. TaxID=2060322 RepID=UPI003D0DE322
MKFDKNDLAAIIISIIMILVAFIGPKIYSNEAFFFNIIILTAVALGLNIIYGLTGYLPFGYMVFFGMGAYGVYIGIRLGLMPIEAFVFGFILDLVLALVLLPLFRLKSHYFAIATLAAFEGIYYLVQSPDLSKFTNGALGASLVTIYNPNLTYIIATVFLVFVILLTSWIKSSRFGLSLRAIRDSVISAYLDGVNVPITRGIAWIISAMIASVAGALYGWYSSFFYPETVFALTLGVYIIAFVLFGGLGTIIGPIIGTVILYSIYQYFNISYTYYVQLFFGILLILLILFLPGGIAQIIKKFFKRSMP